MARRPERTALALLLGALVVAALLGRATAPDRSQNDPRRSSLLAGPAGARGLAEALRRLWVPVEARRRSLQHVDSLPPSSLLALLDIRGKLTRLEIVSVRRYVARGGDLLLAGPSNLGACFGVGVASAGRAWACSGVELFFAAAQPAFSPKIEKHCERHARHEGDGKRVAPVPGQLRHVPG